MARRTQVVVIDDADSRDFGKAFLLTEMDAESAEWWAFRVLQAILGSEIPVDFTAPLAKMAAQGLGALSKLPPAQARPLMEEMMECVRMQLPDGKGNRPLLASDIEEVGTRVKLRASLLELHTGFFGTGGA